MNHKAVRFRRPLATTSKVVAASFCGFVLTFGVVLLVARPNLGGPDCVGESCGLFLAAVLWLAIVVGVGAGATCGFATYVIIRWRSSIPN